MELFLHLAFPNSDRPRFDKLVNADQERLIEMLGKELAAFLAAKEEENGLQRILDRYLEWLKA